MKPRFRLILVVLLLSLAATASWADLEPYSQDFEGLVQADPSALANDGWLVFGNVFGPDWSYWYGYGPFPAPNGGPAFSAVAAGEGAAAQGAQQLSVYSDYNNALHGVGAYIEANVFQEQTVGAGDIGTTWRFEFDAKRGNIEGGTTARAFFKTINPAAGYALTNFIWIDLTNVPDEWDTYALGIFIDPSLEGQLLQFGFLSTATNYQGSGVFYDNLRFVRSVALDIKPGSCPNPMNPSSRGVLPVAILGSETFDASQIDVESLELEGVPAIRAELDDVAAPFAGDLCGCTVSGPDGYVDLTLKFDNQEIFDAIGPTDGGDRVLTLSGTLLDGTPFQGQDCVVFVGGARRPSMEVEGDLNRGLPGSDRSGPQADIERVQVRTNHR